MGVLCSNRLPCKLCLAFLSSDLRLLLPRICVPTKTQSKGRRRSDCRKPTLANGDRVPKKTECLSSCGRAKERQKAEIISELRQRYPLKDLLKLSGMARSTYYYYLKHPTKDKYETEKNEIAAIFAQHKGRYGHRRILAIMRRKCYVLNHKTVQKLMKSLG